MGKRVLVPLMHLPSLGPVPMPWQRHPILFAQEVFQVAERVGWLCSWRHSRKLPVFSLRTDAALLMVQAEEAQWVMKADGYLQLEARAGVTGSAVWDLVQEETGV